MNLTKVKKIKVTHVMSDGTKRDSVKGFVIPYNEDTKAFYEYISKRRKNNVKHNMS